MARRLFPDPINAAPVGANVTGRWVSVQMGRRRSFPIRVQVLGNYAGDDVIIEELVGGVPGNLSLYGNTNLPIGQANDTGTAVALGSIPPGGGDLLINNPTEFIRARTGAFTSGGVTYAAAETLE